MGIALKQFDVEISGAGSFVDFADQPGFPCSCVTDDSGGIAFAGFCLFKKVQRLGKLCVTSYHFACISFVCLNRGRWGPTLDWGHLLCT